MYTSSKFWTPETAHQPKVRLGLTALEAREVPTVGPFDPLGEEVMLNPQPLPPGEFDEYALDSDGLLGEEVMLNPQPLPPGEFVADWAVADDVMLNPQPLPPGEDVSDGTWGDDVMLNPQPLPPQETSLNRPAYLNAGIIIVGGAWSNFARSGIIIVGG